MSTETPNGERRRRRRRSRRPNVEAALEAEQQETQAEPQEAKPAPAPDAEVEAAGEDTQEEQPSSRRRSRKSRGSRSGVNADASESTRAWLEAALEKMGQDVQLSATSEKDSVTLDMSGTNAKDVMNGLGVGRGQVVQALQTLALAHMNSAGDRRAVLVDAAGARQQRTEALSAVADVVAKKVNQHGAPIRILGMNSYERRVVHSALAEHKGIETVSEGEGTLRRLKISANK
jgi:spoIIIJ-associated protein